MPKYTVVCETCGKTFAAYRAPGANPPKYCSRECAHVGFSQKVTVVCDYCGKTFDRIPSQVNEEAHNFCSQDCYFGHLGANVTRTCEFCGETFAASQSSIDAGGGRYCSNECKYADRRSVQKCDNCGKEFTTPKSEARRFCSHACYGAFCRGKNAPAWKGGKVEKTCKVCGKTFSVDLHRSETATYCSVECHDDDQRTYERAKNLVCKMCGDTFSGIRGRKFCSNKCRLTYQRTVLTALPRKWTFEERICKNCGKLFLARPCRSQVFCSPKCKIVYSGPTSIEIAIEQELDARGITHVPQYRIGRFVIDFAFPNQMIAVEADGVYWHSLDNVIEKDTRKDADLEQRGWTVLHFTGDQIRESPSDCVDTILEHLHPLP